MVTSQLRCSAGNIYALTVIDLALFRRRELSDEFRIVDVASARRKCGLCKVHFGEAPKPTRGARALPNPWNPRFRSIGDFEAHLAGGAGDNAEGGFVVAGIQVFALRIHDVHDLFARDFADFGFVRLF
jgi:hypothetical protein